MPLFARRCRDCGQRRDYDHLCPEVDDAPAAVVSQVAPGILAVGEHGYFFSPSTLIDLSRRCGGLVEPDRIEALMRVAVQHAMDREGVPSLPPTDLTEVVGAEVAA